jgi:hypothetical protein
MLSLVPTHPFPARSRWLVGWLMPLLGASALAEGPAAGELYRREMLPMLQGKCFDCHADGEKKG